VAFPGAVGLFAHLDSPTSLAFLAPFGSQDAAGLLSEDDLAAWLHTLPHRGKAEQLRARLQAAPRRDRTGRRDPGGYHRRPSRHAGYLIGSGPGPRGRDRCPARRPSRCAHLHLSAPRRDAARRAAAGRDRRLPGTLPDPESLAGLAGVAPVTRRSGKHISIGFRWAVNRQLRDAVCDFAGDSRHASPWADAIYDAAWTRGKDHPHAVRILARAWIYVIWRCWQEGIAYDPAKHSALQRVLEQQHA
jgi:transposase